MFTFKIKLEFLIKIKMIQAWTGPALKLKHVLKMFSFLFELNEHLCRLHVV